MNTPNQPYGFQGQLGGINDNGTIIGSSTANPSGSNIPFALERTSPYGTLAPTFLGNLGGHNGIPFALSNANQIVGWSEIANGTHHAFLYSNGMIEDLNTLIPSLPGVVLNNAVGIDASGRIVAFGINGPAIG